MYKCKFKRITAIVLLASFFLGETSNVNYGDSVAVRTMEADTLCKENRYTGNFNSSEITVSKDESKVNIDATADYSDEDILFDEVSYIDTEENENNVNWENIETKDSEITIEGSGEYTDDGDEADETYVADDTEDTENIDEELLEDAEIEYSCSFDMDNLVYEFEANLVSDEGEILDTEKIVTNAIITENGGLDACIVIDGNEYMMSDYEKSSSIDECSIATVMNIVDAYLAVSETAEKIRAKSNYKYNKNLEKDGKGVGENYRVYSQSNTTTKNRKAGNYRFGFTTFAGVGCEVAAAYNAALTLGESERLSQTIYYFEGSAIEFSIGWGNLGSNPLEIYRYLKRRGFSYSKYTNWSKFSNAVSKKETCYVIMSRWNTSKTDGLHTFFVKKEGYSKYYGYNWKYSSTTTERSGKKTSISSFNDGSGFIVGYIVWK